MDFHALSRRDLQALCKRNAVRANMSNVAMADALRSLPSVAGLDEIGGTAAAAPMSAMEPVEEVAIEEEKTDGKPPPGGGRARPKVRSTAADKMEQDVRDQATLPGSEGTAGREAVAPVEVQVQVIGEKQGHGCPLPRGGRGRARVKARKAGAREMEEALLDPDALQENQRTAAGEAVAPAETEDVAAGKRRTRRTRKSKGKMALDLEGEVSVAVQTEGKPDTSDAAFGSVLVVSDKSCNDPKEDELVAVVEEDATKPQEGQNVTRTPAGHDEEEERPVPAILRRSQRTVAPVGMSHVEAKEVATGKRRTRRSAMVKMALDQTEAEGATVWNELKDSSDVAIGSAVVSDKSCNDPKMHKEVVVEEEEQVRKGQHEMEEVPAPAILGGSQSTVATVEAEEVATAKKRTRRSRRSKVAAAAQKEQKAGSSDITIGSADKSDDPKEDEVVAVVKEETTKPHDGGSVTMRAVAHKMEEVPVPAILQQSQGTTTLEASLPVEAEEVPTTKRRRRPRRYKVAAAAWNGHKNDADSFDVAIGSPLSVLDQNCDDLREGQLVAGVEEHVAKPQEGIVEEQEQISTIYNSASSGKMEDPPTVRALSKPEAIDVPDKAGAVDEKIVKKDCFTLTANVNQSDLLINTLDRFSKPMYKFTYKEEKKEGARELARDARATRPNDPMNSVVGGLASGAVLGRIQGGHFGVVKYAVSFAVAGTAMDYAALKRHAWKEQL